MSGQPALRAYNALLRQPWAMTPGMVQTMAEIALRENLTPEAVAAQLGRPLDNTHAVTVRQGVAVIPVAGPVMRYAGLFTAISGATSIETLATDLHTALVNPSVHAILLAVDSPGGEVNGIAEFADMVFAARGQKPIAAYIADEGCSAAYWIAAAADEIVVAPTALVGSIGVVMALPDPTQRPSKSIEFVSSQSPRKRPDPTTETGRSTLQATVDALADVFVAAVARYRGVSPETVMGDFGQGGVLVGQAAVDAGLADRVGNEEATIADLAQRARPHMGGLATGPARAQTEDTRMDFKKFWADFFGAAKEAEAAERPATADEQPATAGENPHLPAEYAARLAELEALTVALNAERATAEQVEVERAARAFAEGEIRANRALPAEQDGLVEAYLDAARDDAQFGAITLAEGASTTRVARLTARHGARPAHNLTTEVAPVREGTTQVPDAAPEKNPAAPMSKERRRELLSQTAEGRAILAAEDQAAK